MTPAGGDTDDGLQAAGDSTGRPRLEAHNAAVDEEHAQAGACALVHLPTGRVCTLPHNHPGSCQFVRAGTD